MKIGLFGYGYWGKIIEKNLLDFSKPSIYDPNISMYAANLLAVLEDSTHVFIAVPASVHYDLVNKALDYGCHVFCEKPLTLTLAESERLYEKADKKNLRLYVDWIFTCNPTIRKIKRMIDHGGLGDLLRVSMNRLNLGPIRYDVSARYDLSSHDLSILYYFLGGEPINATHWDYVTSPSGPPGTSSTEVVWDKGKAVINSSWNYPVKNRACVFSFENATVHWDDALKFTYINGKKLTVEDIRSPLEISISEFLEGTYDLKENRDITIAVARLLEES